MVYVDWFWYHRMSFIQVTQQEQTNLFHNHGHTMYMLFVKVYLLNTMSFLSTRSRMQSDRYWCEQLFITVLWSRIQHTATRENRKL